MNRKFVKFMSIGLTCVSLLSFGGSSFADTDNSENVVSQNSNFSSDDLNYIDVKPMSEDELFSDYLIYFDVLENGCLQLKNSTYSELDFNLLNKLKITLDEYNNTLSETVFENNSVDLTENNGTIVDDVSSLADFGIVESKRGARVVSSYYYYWQIYSKTKVNTYGAWRNGPSGKGPAKLTLNNSTSSGISYNNNVSGSYPVGIGSLSANLGFQVTKSNSQSVSYMISIASGQRKRIIYRPRLERYTVNQRLYKVDSWKGTKTYTGMTQTAYVNKFVGWDYSWKYI